MSMHVLACGMSRSGTTLLTTILDSHPEISMGYELLPVNLPSVCETVSLREKVIRDCDGDSEAGGDALRAGGYKPLGTFVKRCARTLTTAAELKGICEKMVQDGYRSFDGIEMRTRLSMAVAQNKMRKEDTTTCGFKINGPDVSAFDPFIPNGRFVYILRDPRDVVASHFANKFDRTLEYICKAWINYANKFTVFAEANPRRGYLLRYEDLVSQPEAKLREAFERLGLDFAPEMLRFFESKASVHGAGHVNAQNLRRNFFSTSIARWQSELTIEQIGEIQRTCGELMLAHDYVAAPLEKPELRDPERKGALRSRLAGKKRFARNDYIELLKPYLSEHVNLTYKEAITGGEARGRKILIIRHDVDHDLETAMRIAKWEHERELRATYCILHTAEYYGEFNDDSTMVRHKEVVDCCCELQALGHEINLHNNFGALALRLGRDPITLLRRELMFLRMNGVDVVGTSTHGDKLCRDLDFRNFELFHECVYEARGGPRVVCHEQSRIELGITPLSALGLTYEAYDIPRDIYTSDSGGKLKTHEGTLGRAGKSRHEFNDRYPYSQIVGVLTHPVWWDFERDAIPQESEPACADSA